MKKSLGELYEKMLDPSIEETVVEESNTFSKFDLDDYTEIIYEGSSGHGDVKKVVEIIKHAIKRGLINSQPKETKSGWILQSIVDDSQYTTHRGEKGYHDVRRYIQRLERL